MKHQDDMRFMREAIRLAALGSASGCGGPFGAVVVRKGRVVGRGCNRVTSSNDPTAHAEIVAIRDACRRLKSFQLDGCAIYASCEPCPMCLGAIYWARPARLVYACTRKDAASIGFDDAMLYREMLRPARKRKIAALQVLRHEALVVMRAWREQPGRKMY